MLAGSPLLSSADEALEYARKVGLPVLLKATGEQRRIAGSQGRLKHSWSAAHPVARCLLPLKA